MITNFSQQYKFEFQELNKCKTELQYWRSRSPATPVCQACGQIIIPVPPEDIQALVNQGLKPEDMGLVFGTSGTNTGTHTGDDASNTIDDDDIVMDAGGTGAGGPPLYEVPPQFILFDDQPLSPIQITTNGVTGTVTNGNGNGTNGTGMTKIEGTSPTVVGSGFVSPQKVHVGTKRKFNGNDNTMTTATQTQSTTTHTTANVNTNNINNSSNNDQNTTTTSTRDCGGKSDNSNAKKIRKVQTKARSQLNVASNSKRSK